MTLIEDGLRDLWDNLKCTNIWIIRVPGEKKKKKKKFYQKIFEEIIVKNFPNTGKEIATQVHETQRVPYKINPKRNTPRHILTKVWKVKHKEKTLKSQGKAKITYKGIPTRLTADFQQKLCMCEGSGRIYLKWWKRKTYNQDYSIQQGSHSYLMVKSKAL